MTSEELKKQFGIFLINSKRTRLEIASELGIPYSTLSSYVNGFAQMPNDIQEHLRKIMDNTGVEK